MNQTEENRLTFLSLGEFVPHSYLADYYGLTWPFTAELNDDFLIWKNSRRKAKPSPNSMQSRYEIELFMQSKHIVSRKWMAVRLGMQVDSFDQVVKKMAGLGLRPNRYLPYEQFVEVSLSEDLITTLPGLRFRTFGDHNSFCSRLHAELSEALKVTIKPLFCMTADAMGDYPRQFANAFDCLTFKPLSTKHAIWLDFRKPLSLEPDRCSKLFYAINHGILRKYCAGTSEPADLDSYLKHVAELADAGE